MDPLSRILPNPHPQHYPTDAEILSSKFEIHKIDIEISKLRDQINQLQAQIDNLQNERDNHTSYISRFRRLPVEVLAEIFQLSLRNGARCEELMKICSTIRNVVIGTPIFWSKIRLWSHDNNYDPLAIIA
ncbi:hypothetical protein CPB86DRAFT_778562 [Serendipita vermifera]|nr:hypothetical protein CPB86DRAFT_778562 [Serendipita vermifera]